jgi:hypothetical protein
MIQKLTRSGLSLAYPENWLREHEDTADGWTVTLQSPGTAFALLSLRTDFPSTANLADSALKALRESYEGIETEPRRDTLAGRPAQGHDIRFFALDLTNTVQTRCFACPAGTVLLLLQATDHEWERLDPVFRAIRASLQVADAEAIDSADELRP